LKLDEFGKDKISYSEFTETDKKTLLEIFLLHETTLQALQKQIFAKKEDLNSFTLVGPQVSKLSNNVSMSTINNTSVTHNTSTLESARRQSV
jgi:hypothetical protein